MTLEKLKEQEKIQLQTQKLIEKVTKNVAVIDAQLQDYYNKNKSMFVDKAAVHAKHILFDEKDKATADKVLAELKAGGDFAAAAKKYSKDTASATKGGDLGWPSTPYVTEFQKAIESGLPGKLVPSLVKTQFGYHIIFVVEKRKESTKKFEEVKDQIKQILVQQQQSEAFQKLLDELKKKAKIEYPNGKPEVPAATPSTGASGTAGQ
jgi:parvulin-like peptidyl-prolyl isomerase